MADKKLFGQAEDNNPPLTDKIAFGTDSNNARNMTFTNLLSWLEGKLGFFRTANNLSEGNASEMRYNIGTYSWSEIDNKDAAKANINDVLLKNNTTSYTPIGDYNPATVKFVNDALKRTRGYYGTGALFLLGNIIHDSGYQQISSFVLRATVDESPVTLPSESVLTNAFGYANGVIISINCHYESAKTMVINNQLIDRGGNDTNVELGKGDSLTVMYVPGSRRNYQILGHFS